MTFVYMFDPTFEVVTFSVISVCMFEFKANVAFLHIKYPVFDKPVTVMFPTYKYSALKVFELIFPTFMVCIFEYSATIDAELEILPYILPVVVKFEFTITAFASPKITVFATIFPITNAFTRFPYPTEVFTNDVVFAEIMLDINDAFEEELPEIFPWTQSMTPTVIVEVV